MESLSHVALPLPPDDPLHGEGPLDSRDEVFLGNLAIKGERWLLKLSADWLPHLRYNLFYGYLERRTPSLYHQLRGESSWRR